MRLSLGLALLVASSEAFSPTGTLHRSQHTALEASADKWQQQGLAFVAGAVISAGVWSTPDSAVAAMYNPNGAAPVVQEAVATTSTAKQAPATPAKAAKATAAPAPPTKAAKATAAPAAVVPKEKQALDDARAAAATANAKFKAAQMEASKAQGVSAKSTIELKKLTSFSSAAKTRYLDANDKLSTVSQAAKAAQREKTAEYKNEWLESTKKVDIAKKVAKNDASVLAKAEKITDQAAEEKSKAEAKVKSAEKTYSKYMEKTAKEAKKKKEAAKKAQAKKAKEMKKKAQKEAKELKAKQKKEKKMIEAKKKADAKKAKEAKEAAKKKKEMEMKQKKEEEERVRKAAAEKAAKMGQLQKEIRELEEKKMIAEQQKSQSAKVASASEAQLKQDMKKLEALRKAAAAQ